MAAIVALSSVGLLVSSLRSRLALQKDAYQYLAIAPRNSLAYSSLGVLGNTLRFQLTPAEGSLGRSFLKDISNRGSLPIGQGEIVVIKQRTDGGATSGYSYQVGSAGLTEAFRVRTLELQAESVPVVAFGVLVGLVVGALFRSSRQVVFCLALLGLLAMSYKLSHACPVCPKAEIGGLDLAAWGALGFIGVLAATLYLPFKWALALGGVVAGLGAAAENWFLWQHNEACIPCAIAGFSCGFILAAAAAHLPSANAAALKTNSSGLLVRSAGLVAVLFASVFVSRIGVVTAQAASGPKSAVWGDLQGLSVRKLGIRPNGRPGTYCIVEKGCGSCEAMESFLNQSMILNVQYLQLQLGVGNVFTDGSGRLIRSEVSFQTPTLFCSDKKGDIVFSSVGYSDSKDWQKSLLSQLVIYMEPLRSIPSKR